MEAILKSLPAWAKISFFVACILVAIIAIICMFLITKNVIDNMKSIVISIQALTNSVTTMNARNETEKEIISQNIKDIKNSIRNIYEKIDKINQAIIEHCKKRGD